jgi:hypothetical protein
VYRNDAEILFPVRVMATLRDLRGPAWQQLVGHAAARPEDDPDVLAFVLMMIRLDGCLTCHPDSFRALNGCTLCARQCVNRFKGTDDDLIRQWEIAREDVLRWLATGQSPVIG